LEGGQLDSAIFHFQESLKIFSQSPLYGFSAAFAHHGLGDALLGKGLVADAIPHYRKALQIKPNYAKAEYDLGRALFREERIDEAITHWQRALSLDPHMANAYASLGDALLRKHLTGEAIACYEKSLQIAPQSAPVLNVLAWVLSTCSDSEVRNGPRAIQLAQQADQLAHGKNPLFIRTLAAAYAESGRFTDAIDAAQRALESAVAKGDGALASELRMDIDLYRMNFPRR
jgi:tetratricopeptide (TPR) repeat protein